MTVLLGATSLVTILVDTVQSGAGVSTGSLTGDTFSLLVDFTVAPLLEESIQAHHAGQAIVLALLTGEDYRTLETEQCCA